MNVLYSNTTKTVPVGSATEKRRNWGKFCRDGL